MTKPTLSYPSCRQPSVVTSGLGAVRALAHGGDGRTAYFLSGNDRVRAAVEHAFHKRGTTLDSAAVIVKPRGEPEPRMVEAGAAFLQAGGFSRVAAIGGGSVLDWCRLSLGVAADLLSLPLGQMTARNRSSDRPELWLVPTTCASGAEAGSVAVFSASGRKVPLMSPAFLADHVLLDPQFLSWLSSEDVACCLCDALSHSIEAYLSIVPSTMAKHAASSALRLILQHWGDAPGAARDQYFMDAAYLGGVAAANCSVGVVHAFAHTMAAYGVPHAAANAAGLLPGLAANAASPALARLATACSLPDGAAIADAIRPIVLEAQHSTEGQAIRHVLADDARRRDIAGRMQEDACLRSNPVALTDDDIQLFLRRVVQQLA
jgi:alcohol dehydrogenase class IV